VTALFDGPQHAVGALRHLGCGRDTSSFLLKAY
jgi:hypothetical protein